MKQKTMCLLTLEGLLAGVSVLGYTAISARAGEVVGEQFEREGYGCKSAWNN